MTHTWLYKQPTEIRFGCGTRRQLPELVSALGARSVLATDRGLSAQPMILEIHAMLGQNAPFFTDIDPNPTVHSVDGLAALIRERQCDVLVAVGGGSALDCAKAAASMAMQEGSIRARHSEGKPLDGRHIPVVALPTTAGTGSEVTPIAVLDDPDKELKAPLVHDNFFPKVALVDPELTVTMPQFVTAATGLDALSHAIEGYWSNNHQPLCEAMSKEAVRLVFRHLGAAYEDGVNLEAREGMSLAALLGGLAFQLPKNAAVHACSYPLCNTYHLAHGAACAMTLDWFIRFNEPALGVRGVALARAAGFESMSAMAEGVLALKKQVGLPLRLRELGATEDDVETLVKGSFHPMIKNNPREVFTSDLQSMYLELL